MQTFKQKTNSWLIIQFKIMMSGVWIQPIQFINSLKLLYF